MGFAHIFVDDVGAAWSVQPINCNKPGCICGLRFSRPSFLEPVEERTSEHVPTCWPNCSQQTLREVLRTSVLTRREATP